MDEQMFLRQNDYDVPVLRVVSGMPSGSARRQDVLAQLMRQYGHRIPPEHREQDSGGSPKKWENYASRAREQLVDSGYLDSPAQGIWQITESGRLWLTDHPNDSHIRISGHRERMTPSARPSPTQKEADAGLPPRLSLEMLEKTKETMGDESFRPVWGALYDQLLAAERAKTITDISDSNLATIARQQVRQIQDYLQGRNGNRPTSEQICDWIHLCYQLWLFREAAALFPLVNSTDVNPWYLERTRKISVASRARQ